MKNSELAATGLFVLGVFAAIAAGCWGYPQYEVYLQRMEGEALLSRSEAEKRIIVEQAKAEVEAARLRAQAIEAIGEAAKEYPEYRHQEFIGAFAEALKEGNIDQIIYVPTEANVPIVEVGR